MSSSAEKFDEVFRLLMSLGLSPETSLGTTREIERITEFSTRDSVSTERQREKWRLKKQRQRNRDANVPGGQIGTPKSSINESKTQSSQKKKKKPELSPGDVPGGQDDGWPVDYVEQFWQAFPPYRRQAKAKVGAKLAKLRAGKIVEWTVLFAAVLKFAATNPGEYAPAPMVWLNDGRWDREYGSTGGTNAGPNRTNGVGGSADVFAAAARRRTGSAFGRDGRAPGAEDPVSHGRRSDAAGSDPRGSEEFAFDLDLRAERVDPVRR